MIRFGHFRNAFTTGSPVLGEAEGQLMLEKASGEETLERKKTGKIPEVPELEEAGAEMPGLQKTGRMLRKLSREEASAA